MSTTFMTEFDIGNFPERLKIADKAAATWIAKNR